MDSLLQAFILRSTIVEFERIVDVVYKNTYRFSLFICHFSLKYFGLNNTENKLLMLFFIEEFVVEKLHFSPFLVLSLLAFFNFGICLFLGKPVSIPLLHLQSVNNTKVLSRSLYSTSKSLNLAASLPFL